MTDKWTLANVVAVIVIFGLITLAAIDKQLQPAGRPEPGPQPDRADFVMWEIILPDYAHSDTLVVIDPDGLNRAVDSCDGSDGDINIVLHQYCKKLCNETSH